MTKHLSTKTEAVHPWHFRHNLKKFPQSSPEISHSWAWGRCEVTVTLTSDHRNLISSFLSASEFYEVKFVPNFKNFHQGVSEVSCSQAWEWEQVEKIMPPAARYDLFCQDLCIVIYLYVALLLNLLLGWENHFIQDFCVCVCVSEKWCDIWVIGCLVWVC